MGKIYYICNQIRLNIQNMNKKSFKSVALLCILLVFGAALSSCEKEYVSELQTLNIQNMAFGVNNDIQQQTFANHDLSNYSITSSEAWVTGRIDVVNSAIIVYVSKNDTYDNRTATLTIKDFKDGISTKSFTVTQDGMKGLIVDEDTYEIGTNGGLVDVTVRKNVDFEVIIPTTDTWVKVVSKSHTRGLENATVTFSVEKNRSGVSRSSVITICNKAEGLTQYIAINQGFTAEFSVDTKAFTCDELANDFIVAIKANFVVDIFVMEEWITPIERTEIDEDNFTQTFRVQPFNDKRASRTANIYIENNVVGKSATIKVTQNRTFYLNIYDKTIEMGERFPIDGSGYFVNTNDRPAVWYSTDTTVVTVNQQGVAIGVGQGTANVVVSSEDGNYTDYMMVTVNRPFDIRDYISSEWSYTYAADTISAVNSTFINGSDNTVYLKSFKLYNDSVKIAEYPNYNYMAVKTKERVMSNFFSIKSSKSYWIDWIYTYNGKEYTIRLDKSGKYYDPTDVVPTPVDTTTTSAAATSRRLSTIRRHN